jgi:hypothetical protein
MFIIESISLNNGDALPESPETIVALSKTALVLAAGAAGIRNPVCRQAGWHALCRPFGVYPSKLNCGAVAMKTGIAFTLPLIALIMLISFLSPGRLMAQQEAGNTGVYLVQSLGQLALKGDAVSPFAAGDDSSGIDYWTHTPWATSVLDQPGDVYLQIGEGLSNRFGRSVTSSANDPDGGYKIAIRLDEAVDVSGTLYVPNQWNGPLQAYRFSVKADQFTAKRNEFLQVKLSHYRRLWNSPLAGAAWFRYQTLQASTALGESDPVPGEDMRRNNTWQTESEMERSLSLVSGGMALSENLQLDRMLRIGAGEDKATFAVDEIEGITVSEFDWKPLIKDLEPETDTLARSIPSDQHAMFLPSLQALVTLVETGVQTAGPLFPLMSDTNGSADTLRRYQEQLGLPLGELQKLSGRKLITSIAITGGDPYFRTGTDVAVLLESPEPATLASVIQSTIARTVNDVAGVERASGTAGRVPYSSYRSPDRRVSSYVATLGSVVLVTNSPVQLNRIVEVSAQPDSALANLDEYRFFRSRYEPGAERETALIVITDQTIRRWCSARWRISASRRTRAAAVLADLHARYLRQLADGIGTPVSVDIGASVFAMNHFTLADHAAISPTYGTLEFLTPVSELDIQQVSEREKAAYENWRRGYQSNWSTAFDPIAIRLTVRDGELAADLTVMPLIDNSAYQWISDVSMGAKLDSRRNAGHAEALTWLALALNPDSPMLKQWGNIGSTFAQINFMDWLGDAVMVYVDDDPLWADMEKAVADGIDQEVFVQSNLHRLPVAIQFNVRSSIRLTAFLAGLRGFIEQVAPDMTAWETLHHRETAYVKISPSFSSRREIPEDIDANIALYYFASSDSLIFSLNEAVIQRAIDRRLDEAPADAAAGIASQPDALPLPGDNFVVQVKRSIATGMLALFNEDYQHRMQQQSWSALPILNEWKRLFPDRDPLEIDRIVWKREMICPGGGEYRWNSEFKTMESSVYGHPAAPKEGPHVAQLLGNWESGNFGLTFEHQGLRAKVNLTGPAANR